MRKPLFIFSILILIITGLLSTSTTRVNAVTIPQPNADFYVLDEANVLSYDTIDQILSISYDIQDQTKAQLVVVILDSLDGQPIENVALKILRDWGIGDAQLDNGVLILISMADGQSRIEVGYGLEGALNDAKTGRIQDTYMLPYFKQGDIDSGVLNGYLAVANEIAKEYNVTLSAGDPVAYHHDFNLFTDVPLWLLILGAVFLLMVLGGLDAVLLGGNLFRLIFFILSGFGSFGSSGGGGSSRKW